MDLPPFWSNSSPAKVARLARLPPVAPPKPVKGVEIIVLSEHVDYFDGEGWRDPWGSPLFTSRQRDYGAALHADDIFTPQMIVDGKTGFVGNKIDVALKEIAMQSEEHTSEL